MDAFGVGLAALAAQSASLGAIGGADTDGDLTLPMRVDMSQLHSQLRNQPRHPISSFLVERLMFRVSNAELQRLS
jgi:hypothetical protein